MRRRCNDDRGATLVILAISSLALISIAGLALDGGRAYGERREMQNAADTGAMAGTRQLDQYLTGKTADARTIETVAKDTAVKNGADAAALTCRVVSFDRTDLGLCPTTAVMPAGMKASAAGVVLTTAATKNTIFMKAVGAGSFTAKANATAQIGRPGGSFTSPFMICASALALDIDKNPATTADDFRILRPDAAAYSGFSINPQALGHNYDIYGNDIKDGLDCGGGSSFRGRVCVDKNKCDTDTYVVPGYWDPDTGNATGPTMRLVNSGNLCTEDLTLGCMIVIPLCPKTNGNTGPAVKLFCTDFGLFELTKVDVNHDVEGIFRGPASFNQGGIAGPADANGARIVALTD